MSDALLSVEVIAKMDALGAGLKTGAQQITDFVTGGNTALKEFEKTLKNVGASTSSEGIKNMTAALVQQRLENEKLRNSILQEKEAQEQAKTTTINSKSATQSNTSALMQQRIQTEAMKTASASAKAQIDALRLSTAQSRTTTVAASGSYAEAQKMMSALGKEIKNTAGSLTSQTPALQAQIAEYRRLNDSLKEVDASMGNFQRSVGDYRGAIMDVFSSLGEGVLSALTPIALVTAALDGLKEIAAHNIAISDNFTDVQRTAKLGTEEVSQFAKELKGLDTRTDLEGLLDIGFIGGRLSVQKKDLTDFVKQVDELSVVLKKEFPGGAEAVAESLGKIVTIYKVTKQEGVSLGTALSKVGSNLLELAHSGPVTVKYLQDFTLGVAGTAVSAKLSIPVITAYGAVLGESGQIASSAALAVTRLVSGLTTKPGKYAAIAQLADSSLTVAKFTKIINTDTKQALDLFFKGLTAGNPVQTEFASRLESVGIKTGKISNAVKILAEDQEKLSQKIAIGTEGFDKNTSVAHNFELANDNLAASVNKLKNSITNLTTDPNGGPAVFFKSLVDGATKSVTALDLLSATIKGLLLDPKKFIADSAKTVRDQENAAVTANAERSAKTGIKNLDDQKEALELLKREVKLRDIIQTQFLKAKIEDANTPANDRSIADAKKFDEIDAKMRFQVAYVKALNSEYDKIYRRGKQSIEGDGSLLNGEDGGRTTDMIKQEIKDLEAANKKLDYHSALFKSNVQKINQLKNELKTANGGKVTIPTDPFAGAEKQVQDFQNKSNLITKTGLAKDLMEWDNQYKSITAVINKLPAGTKKTTAKATLETEYKDGRLALVQANSKQVEEALKKSRDSIALADMSGVAKEEQAIRDKYAEQLKLALGNKDATLAVEKQIGDEVSDLKKTNAAKDFNTTVKQIADIAKEYRTHQAEIFQKTITDSPFAAEIDANEEAIQKLKANYATYKGDYQKFQEDMAKLVKNGAVLTAQDNFNKVLNDSLKQGVNDLISGTADMIGGILSGASGAGNAGAEILGVIGGIATQLGKAAIGIGITMSAIKKAFSNPFTAIAAGIALVALGAYIKGTVANMTSGNSSSSGSDNSGKGAFSGQKFAMGTNYAPGGIALVGEQGPEIMHVPTGAQIIPNHRVMESIAGRDTNPTFVISNKIHMGELVVAIERQKRSNSRT